MTYISPVQTSTTNDLESQRIQAIQKITSLQGARSDTYEVPVSTGKLRGWPVRITEKQQGFGHRSEKARESENSIAKREHIGRLLRQCQRASAELSAAEDPRDAMLAGMSMLQQLQNMWTVRDAREEVWREIINLLQILLIGEDFETLSSKKRDALWSLFQTGVLIQTVDENDLRNVVCLLADAEFDLWRGIAEEPI